MLTEFDVCEDLIEFFEAVCVTKSLQFFSFVWIHDFFGPLTEKVKLDFICEVLKKQGNIVDIFAVVEALVARGAVVLWRPIVCLGYLSVALLTWARSVPALFLGFQSCDEAR